MELRNQQLKLENKGLLEKLAMCNEYSKEAITSIDKMKKWVEDEIAKYNKSLSESKEMLKKEKPTMIKGASEELLREIRRELIKLREYSSNLYTEQTTYEQKYEELSKELRQSKEKTRKYRSFLKEVLNTLKSLEVTATIQRQWK